MIGKNKINNKLARINDEASFLMSIKTTDRLIERVNYNFGISQHHLNLGIFQFNNGNFKSAVLNLNKSLNKAKIINNIDLINSVYSWKINTLFKLKDYLSCEEVLNESLKYLKFKKDTILSQNDTALVAKRLSFLSIISRLDSNFSKSLQLIDSSLFYSYAINDTLNIMKGLRVPPSDKDIDKMPNQKWHQIISFIKSGVRIIGYCFIPFNLIVATVLLVVSEVIGIIEEMV